MQQLFLILSFQLRKMAIDAECETPIDKARGIGKGKKKALDYSRNAEIDRNNVGDVLCFDKTSSIIDPEPGDRTKKIGEFSYERLGKNATEDLKSSFKLTPRDICVRKHQPKLPESSEQRKSKTSKFLTKLLANTAELSRGYYLNKRQENGNELTFCGRETGYSKYENHEDEQTIENRQNHENTYGMMLYHCYDNGTDVENYTSISCVDKNQRSSINTADETLVMRHWVEAGSSYDVLCNKEKEAKNLGTLSGSKGMLKKTEKDKGGVEECLSVENKPRKEMCKKKPDKGLKTNTCMDSTRKEARINRNNHLKGLKKEANGAKMNHCSNKLSFPYSQKTRKVEERKEASYFCNEGKVKRFKPKSGADVSGNISLKKQICELENTDVAHSSEACSDSAFLLVNSEHKLMMTADQTNTGPWNAYVPMTQTLSKKKGSKGCTRSNYTDVFKNKARLYQGWNETSEQQHQKNFELTEEQTAHSQPQSNVLQRAVTSCDSKKINGPLKEKLSLKNKNNRSCAKQSINMKNQGSCTPSKTYYRVPDKETQNRVKTQPTTRHANIVSAGAQTFDLASVFYDIKSAKCNVKTSEQVKPYAGDKRMTCVKSKRTKDGATNKLTRAGETSHGHVAHQLRKDCAVSIETQPFADRNTIQNQVKVVMNRPTTSKDLNYFHNHNSSNPNYSGNTDYQRTCVKENRLEAQEKSFIDTIMEAAKAAAKPSINVNQGQTSTEDNVAKGTKRKLTSEIFDQNAVKKTCVNYPNNDNRQVQVSKGKIPANNKFLAENSGPSDKYRNIMAEKVDYSSYGSTRSSEEHHWLVENFSCRKTSS